MADITRLDAVAILRRTADWMEGSPDLVIRHVLASTGGRNPTVDNRCSTLSPDAKCFCVLGRLAHEARLDAELDCDLAIQGLSYLFHQAYPITHDYYEDYFYSLMVTNDDGDFAACIRSLRKTANNLETVDDA